MQSNLYYWDNFSKVLDSLKISFSKTQNIHKIYITYACMNGRSLAIKDHQIDVHFHFKSLYLFIIFTVSLVISSSFGLCQFILLNISKFNTKAHVQTCRRRTTIEYYKYYCIFLTKFSKHLLYNIFIYGFEGFKPLVCHRFKIYTWMYKINHMTQNISIYKNLLTLYPHSLSFSLNKQAVFFSSIASTYNYEV